MRVPNAAMEEMWKMNEWTSIFWAYDTANSVVEALMVS